MRASLREVRVCNDDTSVHLGAGGGRGTSAGGAARLPPLHRQRIPLAQGVPRRLRVQAGQPSPGGGPVITCITRTARSESLVVRGTGCDVDHLDQPGGESVIRYKSPLNVLKDPYDHS
jgi:hypothetical protein